MRMPILFFLTAKASSLIYTSQQATNEKKNRPNVKLIYVRAAYLLQRLLIKLLQ